MAAIPPDDVMQSSQVDLIETNSQRSLVGARGGYKPDVDDVDKPSAPLEKSLQASSKGFTTSVSLRTLSARFQLLSGNDSKDSTESSGVGRVTGAPGVEEELKDEPMEMPRLSRKLEPIRIRDRRTEAEIIATSDTQRKNQQQSSSSSSSSNDMQAAPIKHESSMWWQLHKAIDKPDAALALESHSGSGRGSGSYAGMEEEEMEPPYMVGKGRSGEDSATAKAENREGSMTRSMNSSADNNGSLSLPCAPLRGFGSLDPPLQKAPLAKPYPNSNSNAQGDSSLGDRETIAEPQRENKAKIDHLLHADHK